jgi:hypothetical protein
MSDSEASQEAPAEYLWPRISIVTPSFNQAHFLEQTIRSVLDQGYPNLEYIIIDGGSTDGSADLIRKYESSLAYWVSEPDRGQTHAINKGMARATGDIVAYLNSDDYYLPGALHRVAREFAAQPDADLFHGRCRIVDEHGVATGERVGRIFSFEEVIDLWGVWWNRRNYVQPEVFWTKRIADRIGPFREDLFFVMDWEYWTRMFRAGGKPAFIDEELSCFRLHKNQKSSHSRRSADEQLTVLGALLKEKDIQLSLRMRRQLQRSWLYTTLLLKEVEDSVARGEPRVKRLTRLALVLLRHPQLLRMPAVQSRARNALLRRKTPEAGFANNFGGKG